jgi:hypothetical protein
VLSLLLGAENNSISNIKLTSPMHTSLIFNEQAKVKEPELREKGFAKTHYSIQHIEGYDLLCYKEKIYILQSLIQKGKEYCHGTMTIYFIRDILELKRLSRIQ